MCIVRNIVKWANKITGFLSMESLADLQGLSNSKAVSLFCNYIEMQGSL